MAPREDVVTSAVAFLQDPSVASSPVEKRIEFLRSKNLTEEEVQLSLARAADPSIPPQTQPQYFPPQQQYVRPPSQSFGYNYNPYGEFQAAPPEAPKRDWRDWFIMATVISGASYGLYVLTDRYVKPLILPPTPPQLEQDKAAIDEQFNRAFALIDALASDTTALKAAEEARTQKLDTVLADVEAVVAELKSANTRREDDARRMAEDMTRLKDSLPTAMDGVKQSSERQLKELSTELASLKTLMGNRMSGTPSSSAYLPSSSAIRDKAPTPTSSQQSSVAPEPAPGSSGNVTGSSPATTMPSYTSASRPIPLSSRSSQFASQSFGASTASVSAGKAAIPTWQMAAQSKAKESVPTNGESTGTATDGVDAVAALSAS